MKLIDEASSIAALRHCQQFHEYEKIYVALARVDTITFSAPMFVGELCNVKAEVVYTSERSIEVQCEVEAENITTGTIRPTNVAKLWYVPVIDIIEEEVGLSYGKISRRKLVVAASVPQVQDLTEQKRVAGEFRYITQKEARANKEEFLRLAPEVTTKTLTLASLVLPDDCNELGNVQGGAILKLIDSAAGIIAFRHARSNAVTARMEALDFVRPIYLGQIIQIDAKLVYTSDKSMDIKVDVFAESPTINDKYLAVTANLVFVGLDPENKAISVPRMVIPEEAFALEEYKLAKTRHNDRKTNKKI